MDAGPEVCRRVRTVKRGYKSRADVVPRHNDGTQVMSVRKERADNQEHGHSREQEGTRPEIVVLIPKEEVYDYYRDIGEPHQIGDDKYLAKRDEVIRSEMNQSVVAGYCFLQIGEPLHIYNPVKEEWQCMSVFCY